MKKKMSYTNGPLLIKARIPLEDKAYRDSHLVIIITFERIGNDGSRFDYFIEELDNTALKDDLKKRFSVNRS